MKINFQVLQKTTRKPTTASPLEVFRVQRGQRYRFRVINSMSHVCPALLEIEKHSLLVIATDGSDVLPVPVDSLYSQPGERYDFVIEANQTGDQFLIRVKGVGYCSDLHLQQFAVLTYVDDYEAQTDPGIAFPQGEFPDYWREFGDGPVSLTNEQFTSKILTSDISTVTESPKRKLQQPGR